MAREAQGAILLALLLAAPAWAATASGTFVVSGEVRLPEGARLEGPTHGVGVAFKALEGPDRLVVRADRLEVVEYRLRSQGVVVPVTNGSVTVGSHTTNATRVFHNATVTLVGTRGDGYVGVEPAPGASLGLLAGASTNVTARTRSVLNSTESTQPRTAEDWRGFYLPVRQPHLLVQGTGAVAVSGPGKVKVLGLTLDVAGDEGRDRIETGSRAEGAAEVVTTWLVLRADDLAVELGVRDGLVAALGAAEAEWAGVVRFHAVAGALESDGGSASARAEAVALEGTFQAQLRPERAGEATHARLDLHGDLRHSTLATSAGRAPLVRDEGGAPWLGLGVGLALASAAATGVLLRRRGRVAPRPRAAPPASASAEELAARADAHVERGELREALRCVAQARRLAPTSASACATQAFLLGELGRVDEALQAWREAARLAPADGEPALDAARLAQREGRAPEVVEDFLEQALARSPAHVEEIEGEPTFRALAGRPRFDHMVEAAWRRHVADLSDAE